MMALFIFATTVTHLSAQTIKDSISMEQNYTQQVFYSLDSGLISRVEMGNWDLAFAMYNRGAEGSAILINEANTTIWAHPGDTSNWTGFDTTGFNTWDRYLNSDTSWTNGALNTKRGAKGVFDMGWGELNPSNNFWTFGHTLYLVKLSNNSYRKLWIMSLKTGVWEFKYANLDGSNEHIFLIKKSDYTKRNFVYHSMLNDTTLDREPDNDTWDLTFMKHIDYINPPGMYVNASSVFNNRSVWTSKAHEKDYEAASISVKPQTEFNQKINNVGREWKRFSSRTGWTVYDSIAYFLYDNDSSDFFRIVFTGFGGSQNGKAYFDKTLFAKVSVQTANRTFNYSLYPNPAADILNVLIDYPTNEQVDFMITDVQGRVRQVGTLNISAGVNHKILDLTDLPAGMYILSLGNDDFKSQQKLIKK